mgnify:FL=1
MDSSSNINSEIVNFKQYIVSNKESFNKILSSIEKISEKSKIYLKSVLTKDERIDNNLLELYQFQTHGYAWFETYKISLRETYYLGL